MNLSPNFTLAEFTASQTAARRGIDNTPPAATLAVLKASAEGMERVRHILGDRVISVSSVYRCPDLNRAVGGAPTSAHVTGHAVDFNCFGFGTPLEVCRALEGRLDYDQLIHEFGRWVHIGFGPRLRRQVLTISSAGTRAGLHPV